MPQPARHTRRRFLQRAAAGAAALANAPAVSAPLPHASEPAVRTVLGPVAPQQLGVTLMHEHAPIVDWSELYETAPGPVAPVKQEMLTKTAALLEAFHKSLPADDGPGAIVETTPIRVGRYPALLVELAKRVPVHVVAATGFWCEALAPQHPWAVRFSVQQEGARRMADLFIREITEGMEDPHGRWGERFTAITAGIIKIGTSTHLRPSERVAHIAAAIASKETGCPITTHTTQGGGLEEAELLLEHGADPKRVIIGHQGFRDDRSNDEATEYHRLIATLGCYLQFDRVGHEKYEIAPQTRQIRRLVDAGFVRQVLVSHDHAPYYYEGFAEEQKDAAAWKALAPDYTVIQRQLVPALVAGGVSRDDIRTILIENPRRVLAF